MTSLLAGLSLVVILSVLARLFGSWVRIPVIVPLLAVGVLAGDSVTGLIDPDELLGDSLSPFVRITVALILFEGALGLRFDQLSSGVRPAVTRLITLGVLVTWAMATAAVIILLDLPEPIAVLIGAVLIVSGPTVVIPLLGFIRPPDRVRSTLKWEGIMIDPVGAIIAVVVYGALLTDQGLSAFSLTEIVFSLGAGAISGLLFSALLIPLLATRRLSGRDKVAATLMMVVASFLAADALYEDAGLVAAIVLGLVMANQTRVNVAYINEFKENLIPILVGILFVLLAANVDVNDVLDLGLEGLALVGFLAFVVRPLAVLTTIGLPFTWKERLFMMTMSSRGIVAASTASAFGLVLVERGVDGAEQLIPVTFLVIAGTVLISSVLGPLSARLLGLSGKGSPSIFMVGAPEWAISLGRTLQEAGTEVSFWSVDPDEVRKVGDAGMEVISQPLDLRGADAIVGLTDVSMVAMVSDDDTLNQLLTLDFAEVLEPDQVYFVPGGGESPELVSNAGRAIRADIPIDEMARRVASGSRFAVFGPDREIPSGAVPLLILETTRKRTRPEVFFACDRPRSPRNRERTVVALVTPD